MNETISRALIRELSSVIQEQTEEGDHLKLEKLLELNDQLLGLLKKVTGRLRQGLKLYGLGQSTIFFFVSFCLRTSRFAQKEKKSPLFKVIALRFIIKPNCQLIGWCRPFI